jgi:uncharacterized protein
VGTYSINIIGLTNKLHHFDYEIGDDFFNQYGTDLISKGSFQVNVDFYKHETFIETDFKIAGVANLACDRTLEWFEHPIKSKHKLLFKYGETNEEISDEIVMIARDTATIDLGQFIYEFIALAVPMKKLHPRFRDEEEAEENTAGKIVYSSGPAAGDNEDNNDAIDPRWNILKKLK